MASSFYGVLGVGPDADAAAIRRGYRERVTDVHPDVNDAPDADAEFMRLTTAKETLLDESERNRYDRLGHREYVKRHTDCSAWTSMLEEARGGAKTWSHGGGAGTVAPTDQTSRSRPGSETSDEHYRARTDASERTQTTESETGSNAETSRESAESGGSASATTAESRRSWQARDWTTTGTERSQTTSSEKRAHGGTAKERERTATGRERTAKGRKRATRKRGETNRQSVGGSYATSSFWESQRVGERRETGRRRRVSLATRLFRGLRELGPWVLVHVVFLTIAVGTCWYVYANVLSDSASSLPLLLALIGEVVLAVVLSTIHVLSRLYR